MKIKHKNLMKKNEGWTSLTAFNNMIIDGDMKSIESINKWFDVLVDKKDYNRAIRDNVLEYSYGLIR